MNSNLNFFGHDEELLEHHNKSIMTLEELIQEVEKYNPEAVESVIKAYNYADAMHGNQMRQSGEPYITHPLRVAYILAEMHADEDTLCAGLLHDTLEDTKATKDEIIDLFNDDVYQLVDGVTNISKMHFSSKSEQVSTNTRKIIVSITKDVRIIIVKLADRLHNMRTLEFKSPAKQKEKALETMEIFVPLAYNIGAYKIKNELEDLCLRYLKPDEYNRLDEKRTNLKNEYSDLLEEMLYKINKALSDKHIPNEIRLRIKNIYGIYKKMNKGYSLNNISDLYALKVIVDDIDSCYLALGTIHSNYNPVPGKFKDYICAPKTNMYKSLHTTVYGINNKLVQTQIRTYAMDQIACNGLTAYWDINKGDARITMQEDLKNKYQFFKSLVEINNSFGDNEEFVNQTKQELFKDKVYVKARNGKTVELPKGATALDFAYSIHSEIGNDYDFAIVNNEPVPRNYVLKNKDRVTIVTNENSLGPTEEWLDDVVTTHARSEIKRFINKDKVMKL